MTLLSIRQRVLRRPRYGRKQLMPQHDLTETLQVLVRRHGMSSVLHSLADIQASPESPISSSSPRRTRNAASKSSAVDYVARMTLPPDKAEIMSCSTFRSRGIPARNRGHPRVLSHPWCRIGQIELAREFDSSCVYVSCSHGYRQGNPGS